MAKITGLGVVSEFKDDDQLIVVTKDGDGKNITRRASYKNVLPSVTDILSDAQNLIDQSSEKLSRVDVDVVGDPSFAGAIRQSLFQGYLSGPGGAGDFAAQDIALAADGCYLHFETPLSIDSHNEMFYFELKAASYGDNDFYNIQFMGYCYSAGSALHSSKTAGELFPHIYVGSNDKIYLRIKLFSATGLSVNISTMRHGNGRLFDEGCLKVVATTEALL